MATTYGTDMPGQAGTHGGANNTASDSELRAQIDQLKADLAELNAILKRDGQAKLEDVQARAAERVDDFEEQIRRKPLQAAAIAAGVGFLVGAVLSR